MRQAKPAPSNWLRNQSDKVIGVAEVLADPDGELSDLPISGTIRSPYRRTVMRAFRHFGRDLYRGKPTEEINRPEIMKPAWQHIKEAADRHYQPGKFTTLVGYEFTSSPGYTFHRNVIFRSDKTPDLPFTSLMSRDPEDLWDWLDAQREKRIMALAIPHNSNLSKGNAFDPRYRWTGGAFDAAYAEQRMRNEPPVEVTQVKGTSETHPALSPNDEWADFKIHYKKKNHPVSGGYVREANLSGLKLEQKRGFNPYRFGLIGSSDTHNAGAGYRESNFFGKIALLDGLPKKRGSVPQYRWGAWEQDTRDPATSRYSASGLAPIRTAAPTTAAASISKPAASRLEEETSNCGRFGAIPNSSRAGERSITLGCWKIRTAAGPLGTLSGRRSLPIRGCR